MTRAKNLTQLLFFIVIIIYTAKFIWHETKPNYNNLSLVENIYLQNITATKFDTAGNAAYLLTGKNIQQQHNLNRYNITDIKLLKKDTSPTWELTAAHAIWDQIAANITLKDQVQVLLSHNYAATTDFLELNLKNNTASTPSTVKFHNNNTTITAQGMELNLAQTNIKLQHNINGKTTK
jgi:LPS export ABC transporter protein LptC